MDIIHLYKSLVTRKLLLHLSTQYFSQFLFSTKEDSFPILHQASTHHIIGKETVLNVTRNVQKLNKTLTISLKKGWQVLNKQTPILKVSLNLENL